MSNIIFTNKCNISCPFCFASENNVKDEIAETNNFNIEQVWRINNYLNSNSEFRFCGGEPTQNPEIIPAISLLLSSKRRIFIMTNGIWPDDFLSYINLLPQKFETKIRYLFNVLHPNFYKGKELEQIHQALKIVNPCNTTIGFTVYNQNFDFDYIIDLAELYNIKNIRWSVAAPNLSKKRKEIDEYFPELSGQVAKFIESAVRKGMKVTNDCGYIPLCYYSEEQLSYLLQLPGIAIKSNCEGSPVDIDNKFNAWRCYGLYSLIQVPIDGFSNETELGKYFDRRIKILNNLEPYQKCNTCKFWQNSCGGGCYAIRIRKVLQKKPHICFFPIDDDQEILHCIPERIKELTIREDNDIVRLYCNQTIIENPDENKLVFLRAIDGRQTIQQLIELWKSNFSSDENTKKQVIQTCRELFEKDFITIKYKYSLI